jgi:hypothetical protein
MEDNMKFRCNSKQFFLFERDIATTILLNVF